ncbi:MAG: hypothetical protein VYA30_09365, partial [Myxococcota bacterium]|nr:hypothetical protein [Myxococcota bacterium]
AETGFDMSNGIITGYLTIDSLVSLVTSIVELCESPEAPSFCAQAGMFLGGDPRMTVQTIILPILRGADSLVTETSVEGDCGSDECNAVSVCLLVEGTATTLSGITGQ